MPQLELEGHRRQIAALVDVELDGYFRADMSESRRALTLSRWCDELQDWPVVSITAAFSKWVRENPRLRPNYGDILQLLKAAWGERNAELTRAAIAPPVEAPKPRVSDESRQAILREMGMRDPLAIKTIDGIQPNA